MKPKPTPKPEPVEEKTTSSSYFSSTGKNRVTHSVPIRESRPKKVIQIDDDDEATDDVFEEKFKKNDDDYQEEPDMDEDMDDFVVPDEDDEDIKPKKKSTSTKVTSGNTIKPKPAAKKRKIDITESEEEDEKPAKKKTPAKKAPAVKKPRTPAAKKADAPINSATQKIIDSIPLIDAPEPPKAEDGSVKKPNFYAARAARAAVETSGGGEPLDMPTGAENCLAGLAFVFTGVTEGLSREDGQQLVKKHGGFVVCIHYL